MWRLSLEWNPKSDGNHGKTSGKRQLHDCVSEFDGDALQAGLMPASTSRL